MLLRVQVSKMKEYNIIKKVLKYPISMTALKACKTLDLSDRWIPKKLRARATLNRQRLLDKATNRVFTIIDIPTYDGFNQTVHPDVIKQLDNNQKEYYLMAITPYPYGYDKYENPCIYNSADGVEWRPLRTEPLFFPSRGRGNHLSDPELVVSKEKIFLYFRECIFGEEKFDIIYRSESKNLIDWSEARNIITMDSQEGLISPTIIQVNDAFINFIISKTRGLLRNKDKSGKYENAFYECCIKGEPRDRIIWHIDIKQIKEEYLAGLFVYATELGGREAKLFYAESYDSGCNWDILGEIKLCDNQEEIIDSVYRATIVEDIKTDGYNLYVSLMTKEYSWHTVLIKQFSEHILNVDYLRKD